jgi:hypothetical protein
MSEYERCWDIIMVLGYNLGVGIQAPATMKVGGRVIVTWKWGDSPVA